MLISSVIRKAIVSLNYAYTIHNHIFLTSISAKKLSIHKKIITMTKAQITKKPYLCVL